jgi:small-conductance mechanosensitive channel/CRP-like cAMP-binding protein
VWYRGVVLPRSPASKAGEASSFLPIVLAAAALAVPLEARAQDLESSPEVTYHFATSAVAVLLFVAVIAVAFLTNRFAPKKRRHMRNTAGALLLFVFSLVAAYAFEPFGAHRSAHVAREIAELLGTVTAVNLCALLVFDLGLSAIGLSFAPFLGSLVVVVGNVAAIGISLNRIGVNLSSILATSAVLGAVTTFSLQGTLSNVVGGIALEIDDAIRVGDWVQLENGKQGKVREIRWRYTVVETRDWDTMIVPNATFLSSTVTILGKREGQPLKHRMWVYFNVDFRSSPSDVVEVVDRALQAAPIENVATDPAPHAICMDFAKDGRDSYAYYAVRYWLLDLAKDDPTSSRVRERIFTALKRAGIPLAIPGGRVWVEQDDQEHRERKKQHEAERRQRALDAVEFLRTLRDDERGYVADRLKYALFAPGETITKQGAVAHWLYIIVGGIAEVRVCVDKQDRALAKIQAPGFVGEMGLMTGEPRTATVVALTEVECYRLDKEGFNKIITDRPEIAGEISCVLASRKVELQAMREDLDADSKRRALDAEHRRILQTIQRFFGLEDDNPPTLS